MIEVQHLTKRYGSHVALQDISFQVNDGEILGFLGPNGAGKSTTMNILTGYLSASDGVVRVNGHDVLEDPNKAKSEIGYLPEQPPLYMDMTVREYLNFMYDLKKCALPRTKHIAEICRLMKIDNVYGRLIKNLSKGYRQRVGFAQALQDGHGNGCDDIAQAQKRERLNHIEQYLACRVQAAPENRGQRKQQAGCFIVLSLLHSLSAPLLCILS